jgi:hypothetical protein
MSISRFGRERPNIELIAGAAAACSLIALSIALLVRKHIPYPLTDFHFVVAFGFLCSIPFFASWRQAIKDGRLPIYPMGAPKHQHISGWGFLTLAFIVGLIVGVAAWAAPGHEGGRGIQSSWGVLVVAGLALFFIAAAIAPNAPEMPSSAKRIARVIGAIIGPFGRILSVIDSMMVFAVAGGAGATRSHVAMRYFILASTLAPCAILAYWLEPPYAFGPIIWGFTVAISISRRWAWVENDRELSMLNRLYTGSHLRVGFGQDLRDEALLSFMAMFVLVPLALRQAQIWADIVHFPLFDLERDVTFVDWIGFYGTELAKAVPFVDWAEVYDVAGVAPISVVSEPARHVVFATRVLVDLVFLAALVQAIGISTRNAKQKELFFRERVLDRLDPFIEPKEFRRLLMRNENGELAPNPEAIAAFPPYDKIRLGELADPSRHPDIYLAAKELRLRDGGGDSGDFHDALMARSMHKRPDADGIMEVITAIRTSGPIRQPYELNQARIALNGKPALNSARAEIMRLIIESPDSKDRRTGILSALIGPDRDTVLPVRKLALEALKPLADEGSADAIGWIRNVASQDLAVTLRRQAKSILRDLEVNSPKTKPQA